MWEGKDKLMMEDESVCEESERIPEQKHQATWKAKRQQAAEMATPQFSQDWADTSLAEAADIERMGIDAWVDSQRAHWQSLGHTDDWIRMRIMMAKAQAELIATMRRQHLSPAAIRSLLVLMGRDAKSAISHDPNGDQG